MLIYVNIYCINGFSLDTYFLLHVLNKFSRFEFRKPILVCYMTVINKRKSLNEDKRYISDVEREIPSIVHY